MSAKASRSAVSRGREAVVSLTQTEIILVLATVLLLLLLGKNSHLATALDNLANAEETVQRLDDQMTASPDEIAEQREQADLAREVKEVLSRDGRGELAADRPRLAPQDVEEVRQALQERDRQRAEQAAVDEALARSNIDASAARERQLERLGDAAATGTALRDALSTDRAAALDAAQAGPQPEAQTRKLLAAWLREDAQADSAGAGDKVGFTPCWPRAGERGYLFAYDITYANEEYELRPHTDWESGAMAVADALAGPLGQVLRGYPQGPVGETSLREFGRRVEAAIEKRREQGIYREDCLLAVTLNGEASGNVAKFIRQSVLLYPVTR